MVASALPIILFTLIWGAVAASGYWVPKGPHQQLFQVRAVFIIFYVSLVHIMASLGLLDPNRGLLLVILAVLLHEPDEPTYRPDRHTQNCGCHPLVLGQFHRS